MSDRRALLRLSSLTALAAFAGGCGAPSAVAWSPREQIIGVRNRDRDEYVDACGVGNAVERAAAEGVYDTIVALAPVTYAIVTSARQPPIERLVTKLSSGLDVEWTFVLVDQRATTDVPASAAFWRGSPAPMVVRSGPVLVVAPPAEATTVTRLGRAAVARVLANWPAPPTAAAVAIVVARNPAAFESMAGSAGAAGSSVRLGSGPLTVVLAPGPLSAGGQIPASVLTHECVHVIADLCALRAGADRDLAPRWLREGLAEYLSAKSLGLAAALETSARAAVRAAPMPTGFPADTDFDAAAPDLAYDVSWAAVDLLAAQLGDRGLITWYRAWSTRPAGAAAGSWPAGVDAATTRRRWLARLSEWRR